MFVDQQEQQSSTKLIAQLYAIYSKNLKFK